MQSMRTIYNYFFPPKKPQQTLSTEQFVQLGTTLITKGLVGETDELAKFDAELAQIQSDYESRLQKWKEERSILLAVLPPEDQVQLEKNASITHDKVTDAFSSIKKGLLDEVKSILPKKSAQLLTPKGQLEAVLKSKIAEQINELYQYIQELCEQLNKLTSPDDQIQKNKICVMISDSAISMLTKSIEMHAEFRGFLTLDEKLSEFSAEGISQLIRMAILVMAHIPLPDLSYKLDDFFRNSIFNNIEEPIARVKQAYKNQINELGMAQEKIEQQIAQLSMHASTLYGLSSQPKSESLAPPPNTTPTYDSPT